MESTKKYELKIYKANECCVFRKTKELFGGLSNMASGYPIKVNEISILSSEALYQACRFPHLPDVQEKIILERSPMSAKMVGKPFRKNSRSDWDETRTKIMRWCLRVKLAQNFIEFGKILESTNGKPIVEDSSKDDFWGAIRDKSNDNVLKGVNGLGRLLMELRQFYNEKRYTYEMFVVEPLQIPDFKLYGKLIDTVDEREKFISMIKKSTRFYEIENIIPWSSPDYKSIEIIENVVNEPEQPKPKEKIAEKTAKKQRKTTVKKVKSKQIEQEILPF